MKKLLFILLFTFSYSAFAADMTCRAVGNKLHCNDNRIQHQEMWETDYKAAGQGLRNILRWLDENSTSNTNKKTNSSNSYKSSNSTSYSGSSNNKVTNYNIPANAYRTKGTWKCLSGYKRSGNQCKKISNSNKYSNSTASGFCRAGYKKSGNVCIKDISTPSENPTSDSSGNCNPGYFRYNGKCSKKYIPANAFASGSGWLCKAGYTKSNSSCIKSVEVPENGYAAGYTFLCFNGYKKIGSQCIKEQNEPLEDSGDYLEKIKQAKVLLDSGVITEDEFAEIKKRIIDNI